MLLLGDRGAFELRRSVEAVAEAMGVSRFTIYNYLNAVDGSYARCTASPRAMTPPSATSAVTVTTVTLRAEFTVEPFVPGAPGPHVHAAIDAAA